MTGNIIFFIFLLVGLEKIASNKNVAILPCFHVRIALDTVKSIIFVSFKSSGFPIMTFSWTHKFVNLVKHH